MEGIQKYINTNGRKAKSVELNKLQYSIFNPFTIMQSIYNLVNIVLFSLMMSIRKSYIVKKKRYKNIKIFLLGDFWQIRKSYL